MKIKTCGIYKITSITGSIYIGQSTHIESRFEGYKKLRCKGQPKLHSSFKKHGVYNHAFEIIEECIQDLLNEREVHWVEHFNTFNTEHGMNLTSGGEHAIMSQETRKRISQNLTGKKHSEERNKKQSEKLKGTTKSEEFKKKISDKMKGVPKSEEHRKNLKGNKNSVGNIKSEEGRKNVSKANIGNKYASGKRTEEQNKRNSKSKMGNKSSLGHKQSPEHLANKEKTRKENKQLKQHVIQSILFRESYFKQLKPDTFIQEK